MESVSTGDEVYPSIIYRIVFIYFSILQNNSISIYFKYTRNADTQSERQTM